MKSRTCRLAVATMAVALTASQGPAQSIYTPYTFTTLAGNAGYGTGSGNSFNYPNGVTVDSAGNLYVADSWNHAIRKVTPTGVVTTLAGLVLSVPHGVAVDSAGNLYVADTYNHTIRKLTAGGEVTTLAGLAGNAGSVDGTGSAARFKFPLGLAVDGVGNVFVADTSNSTIRKVTPAGLVTTLAGLADNNGYADATGTAARFNYPAGVAADSSGNVYVADAINHTIRKVTSTGVVTTLAGLAGGPGSVDGIANAARFNYPAGVALDSAGNLYVADEMNHTIRKVTPAGEVTTLAGLAGSNASADGAGRNARFYEPRGVAVDSAGNTYVADSNNHRIRKVTPTGEVTTLAGLPDGAGNVDGTATAARFYYPLGVAADGAGNVYVADTSNHTIRKVTPTGEVTPLAGLAGGPGSADGTGSDARFSAPYDVAVDGAGNVYVADLQNNRIRKVTASGEVTTLAGLARGSADGTGSDARFFLPAGVAVDSAGNVYVADTSNHTIRKVTPGGEVTTVAGLAERFGSADGAGNAARFFYPQGLVVDGGGNMYVADTYNHTIRKITPQGLVTTLAGLAGGPGSADGTGTEARFYYPGGVAADNAGNVYVAGSDTIRKVSPAGVVTTLAGLGGSAGYADGTGSVARFRASGVAVDTAGNVYVADGGNNTIRKGYPALMILSSGPGFGFNGGQFGFNLIGPTEQSVVMEASTDLVSWVPLWTNTFTGALNFSDPQSGAISNRFYRARLP